MNVIQEIIAVLSKEEKQQFLLEMKKKDKRNEGKNIQLFQLLNSGKDQKDISVLLYETDKKGAYHALCKRLYDSLVDFIASKSFHKESSYEMETLKLLLASRIFFEHKLIATAFKTLKKAEVKAVSYNLYSILNEIYFTQMQYAHLHTTLNLGDILQKQQQNKLKLEEEEKLNLFYATVKNELVENSNDISEVINRNLRVFDISITENLNYGSLLKILDISNEVGYMTRNYKSVLSFIEEACEQIEISERIQDKHLNAHIQVLYYLSNTYFRIKQFELSKKYLLSMQSYMELQDKKYKALFYPQFVLLQSLNYIYTGNIEEAIASFENFDFKKYKNELVYCLDLKLSWIVALCFQEKFKKALHVFNNFYHSDNWYISKTGIIWTIKKNLIEILLLIELDYYDLVVSRIKSFRKKYRTHLKAHGEDKVLEFLKLMVIYYNRTEEITTSNYKERISNLLKGQKDQEDIFVISFYAWMQAKIKGKEMYPTCLDLIGK